MKIISMYLSQFHRVKENDEWWGEGYTEWTAVKKADNLYEGHIQPHTPLNENYYDLMKKETMKWQSDLMHRYGIDGQCFYHYWFKDGKQILEKPAENLLQWTDIDMPFCFCWANQTWARTWSNVQEKNEWAFRFEKRKEYSDSGILLEQKYGTEKDWRIHYEDLRRFFKDKRYLKNNGKPVFLIYRTGQITCLRNMLRCWNRWALEDGFKGIYVIGAGTDINTEKHLDGVLNHEPQKSISKIESQIEHGIVKYQYEELWNTLLSAEDLGKKTYYGGFVGYDDTPRRGRGGTVIEGASPELFQKYLSMLIAKNDSAGNEYTFLNAWNEWGEGMYLEPDMENGYSYLEAVKGAREHYTEYIDIYKEKSQNLDSAFIKELDFYRKKVFRYEKYWKVFDAWMRIREQGKRMDCYLSEQGIKTVGIYGAGMMGKHLIAELSGSKVETVFAIDQKADFIKASISIYRPDEAFPEVDAVVIAVLFDVEGIKKAIQKRLNCKIISLEKIIADLDEGREEK